MKTTKTVGFAIGGVALVAAIGFSVANPFSPQARDAAKAPASADVAAAQGMDLRLLLVADPSQTAPSPADLAKLCQNAPGCDVDNRAGLDAATLLMGAPPRRPTRAVILTDVNCAPDGFGISHCLNKLQLTNGTVLEVRHNHDMQRVRCLTPGETVQVITEAVG